MIQAITPLRVARVVARIMRVTCYASVVTGVFALFAIKSVRGQVAEKTFTLGRELAPFADLLRGTHRVVLNGEPIYVASAITDQTMGAVLDRFQASCEANTGGVLEQLDGLPAAAKATLAEKAPAAWEKRSGVWREDRATEGSLICIERTGGHGLTDAVKGLKAFAASGDVHALGNFRYAYVRPTDNGRTHVLSTFTEGEFNVFKVIGRGVAEPSGTDPAETPRLPDATRVLSAEVDGRMYGTYLYASPASPEQALGFYERSLPDHGWQRLIGHAGLQSQVWQREGVTMVVNAIVAQDGEGTRVSLSQGRTVSTGGAP